MARWGEGKKGKEKAKENEGRGNFLLKFNVTIDLFMI